MAKLLLLAAAALVGSYLILLALLFTAQRRFIYPAPASEASIGPAPPFEEVQLRTEDGLTLRALYRSARPGSPTLVFFHGNGDNLRGALVATEALASAGFGLLLPEYRGYGGNPGSPSEQGLYRDGEGALRWLGEHGVPAARVVVIGNSLGSGVATELARRHPVAGLVIVSGFTSLPDVASRHLRIFPIWRLLRDRYENAAKLPDVVAPVLVLHGTRDTLIPAAHGERLAGAARQGVLELVPGAGHELAYLPDAQRAILRWLEAVAPSPSPATGSPDR